MRLIGWLMIAVMGGLLALAGQKFLHLDTDRESVVRTLLPPQEEVTRPPRQVGSADGERIRRLVLISLDSAGVIPQSIQVGHYPLRGAGRLPNESFPLVSFTCPADRSCDLVLTTVERNLKIHGLDMVGARGGDRLNGIRYRALVHGDRPVLALRAYPPGPRLCLVVGDVGQEIGVLDHLLALSDEVTYAVLANSRHSLTVSKRLMERGREIIAHLPMEPIPPRTEDGPGFLKTSMTPNEIKAQTLSLLKRVPGAVGADGHLGGRLTSSRAHIGAVLDILFERGLFFLDDRPADTSVTLPVARSLPVRTAVRTHRIEGDEGEISEKLRAVEVSLVLDGQALVVVSPHPELLKELRPWLEGLKKRKIHLLRLSEMVL